jgi:hypothetical protein
VLLEVELIYAELEEPGNRVAVELSSMLLRTEGVVDGSRTTTLEEVTEDVDINVDTGNSTTNELFLLGKTKVTVGKAEPSPSTNAVEE